MPPTTLNEGTPLLKVEDEEILDFEEVDISPLRRYYTPEEVAAHNIDTDCWVSWLGKVYNLTSLISEYEDEVEDISPIVSVAGTDISDWFDAKTGNLKTHIHPITGLVVPFTPLGKCVHVPPPEPRSDFQNDFGTPWWKDEQYCIGNLTEKIRKIKIVNTLTEQEHIIDVCSEETITEIATRFLLYNRNCCNYVWKRLGVELDMDKTLEENGIEDESDVFKQLNLQETFYVPAIHIHFKEQGPIPDF